ncbi:hypothetical protein C3L33_08798, partial [Rhododendron williamsianum]
MSDEGPFPGNEKAAENDTKTKEGENKKPKRVPFLKLFAFADTYDCFLMSVGSVGACINGASVPVFFVFFGKIINVMGMAYLFPAAASHRVAKYSLDFVYLSLVILFSSWTGEERALRSYRTALLSTYQYGKKAGLAKGLGLGTLHCVLFLSWSLLVWFTSIVVHKNIADGGKSFTTMLNVVISGLSLGQAAPDISAFIRAKTAAYPIFEMIERNTISQTSSKNGRKLDNIEGHIQFTDVCFNYPSRPDVMIFNKLNLDIPSGKVVALVGASGSGKSTVVSLIERFYEPLSGQILLDGTDILQLDLKWLRKQIGLVNQEPALFATTIRENILYGKNDATHEEITRAARLSEAIGFISNLSDGFETQVGERGVQLSGGQKQRIAISRAIVKNPSILLLDEATSALDAECEKSVQEALDRVMVGRTTVVVAHRLSTIRNADVIAVVQSGKIVETGSHDELVSQPNSAYASLVQASLHQVPSLGPTLGRPLRTSHVSSLQSDKALVVRTGADGPETVTQPRVSSGRLYSMVGPEWIYGVAGTICALIAGAQMPLFALGISQALVSYYMDWDTTTREVKKISLLFSILKNEIGWFDDMNNTSSMLASRLEGDATLLRNIVVDRSTVLIQNSGLVVTSFIIAFILNWRIALVVMATYPLIISGHLSEKMFMTGYGGNLSKAYLKANMLASESVSNIRTVIAFCSEEKVLDLYAQELVDPSRKSLTRGQIAGIFFGVTQFFIFSSYGLALWYGSVLMGKELSSFESIMKTFMVLIVTALTMGSTLAMAPDLLKGNQMVASVFEVLDRKAEVIVDSGEELASVEGTIELRGVQFSYPSRPNELIFVGFDLIVCAGQSMALVGRSGSGKSSVLALVLRFYDPTAGNVMIDGKDVKKLKLKSLRTHIGLVQQEPALFATSIFENILYGKEGASEGEVIEAAKLANAHSFISALPEGYSTRVGERGVQLSGGQKQRVAIARAVLKNPAILLLDEATSALDVESERVVQQALDQLMKNRTTVVVAHRLSTIKNADQISVIQDGKIIEQGTHSTLVENRDGAYFKLISLQQQQQQN